MGQKTIESEELAKVKNLGIESFVKCTKNAHDEVSGLRSINLNFEIKIDGQLVGKGNNLNINNLTETDYISILRTFGLTKLDDRTPFVSMLYTATGKAKVDEWITARARKEKEIDDDQKDITENPDKVSTKQKKFIKKLRESKVDGEEIYQKIVQGLNITVEELDRNTASELIDQLQLLKDRTKDDCPEACGPAPKKKKPKKK